MNGNKIYEINIDVDLYRKITNSLNNIIGDLNRTLSKAKINPFSGELLTYYNNLENNVSSKLESIIGEIEELGLKIDTSINTYQNIDEELRFGLDSIVDKIFEVGNGSGISIEFDGLSTYQERKEYLEKLIESYTTTLEELKKEYNNLYGNGIVIEYHEQFQNWFTIVTSLGGVNNFNSGLGNIYNQNGNLDIDNLSIILNFYKENNLNVKLKNYIIDGKSWSDSGLSSFNDNELTDNENEFNFLYSIYDSFGISSNEYVENIFFDGYDSYNEENINTAKSFLSQKMDFNLFGKLNETYTDCITKQADIINLQSAIYNYEQYQKLMPFEEARRNIDYLDYISKDYSNYDNDILNGNMYGGKYKDYLNYMDQSEVALYDYIYTKQGSDIAETYLFALTDTINQRKGFEKASNYVSNLNQNGLDAGDFFASGWEGFKDGNITFFNGISNFFTADGVVSAFDYEMLYKMQLLSSDEYRNYTNNLSDEAKKFLSYNYQINNSIGNMTIPMLVSFVPVVGKSASSALMWTSSTGNATEQAMQGGASKSTAYLYGGLSGLSEVALERVMGGIPGLSDGVSIGFKGIFKDMLGEAKEEGLQSWIDAGLRAIILGEEIDLTNVTGESIESAIMGMFVSGQMKVGMSIPVKIGNKIINISTNGEFSDYQSFKANIEMQFENNGIDVTSSVNNSKELPNIPNLKNVTFDPESNLYKSVFDNGKTMFVENLSDLNNVTLKKQKESYIINNTDTNNVVEEVTKTETSVNVGSDSILTPNISSNTTLKLNFDFNKIKENIQNTTGAILTKVGEVGNLLKGFVLNTAMAEEDIDIIDEINAEETIVNINTEDNTADLSKPSFNFNIDFASIKEKVKNTTGVVLTKVGEAGKLLKGFILTTAIAEEDADVIDESVTQTNELSNNLTEINSVLSATLPANYYCGDITISNNRYTIPIIYSESSLDYSTIDMYPVTHYVRVYTNIGNIEQQIRAQLANIVSENTKINKVNNDQTDIITGVVVEENHDNVTIEQNDKELHEVEFWLDKVTINPYLLKDVSQELLIKHPQIALEAVKQNGYVISKVSEKVQIAHPEIALEAVKQNGWFLQYVAPTLRQNNLEVTLEAIKQSKSAIQFISDAIFENNLDVMLPIIEEISQTALRVIMSFVGANGLRLKYLSDRFKESHPAIVMEAVKQNGLALQYVSKKLQKASPGIPASALMQNSSALQFVDNSFWLNASIARESINNISKLNPSAILKLLKTNSTVLRLLDAAFINEQYGELLAIINQKTKQNDLDMQWLFFITENFNHDFEKKILELLDFNYNSHISDYLHRYGDSKTDDFGVNQGGLRNLADVNPYEGMGLYQEYLYKKLPMLLKPRDFKTREATRLKEKLQTIGFSELDARVIMDTVDSVGACSYAAMCNVIFELYKNNQSEFEKYFGYSMYINKNGRQVLNANELLLDLYVWANTKSNGGYLFLDDHTLNVDALKPDEYMLNAKKQQYMSDSPSGFKVDILNRFLESKSLKTKYERSLLQPVDNDLNSIKNQISEALANGWPIDMGIYNGTKLLSNDSALEIVKIPFNKGHAVFVVGMNESGVMVSSWGKEYLITFDDLFIDADCQLSIIKPIETKIDDISSIIGISSLKNVDQFFGKIRSLNGMYGADQGTLTDLFYNDRDAYNRIRRKMVEQYKINPNYIEDVLDLMDSNKTGGACPSANSANIIFQYFSSNPEKFQEYFGFPMYISDNNGGLRLNSEELLLDMFYWVNTVEYNGLKNSDEGLVVVDHNSVFGNLAIYSLEKYLKTKSNGISVELEKTFIHRNALNNNMNDKIYLKIQDNNSNVDLSFEQMKFGLQSRINEGQNLSVVVLGKQDPINFYDANTKEIITSLKAHHWVKVTGITDDGIIVSSWGRRCLITYADLLKTNNGFAFYSTHINGEI